MSKGKTIILITHNIEFAMEYLPRTILMAKGMIIADGPTKEILNNELLVKESHLILPQIQKFKLGLQELGIQFPKISIQKMQCLISC